MATPRGTRGCARSRPEQSGLTRQYGQEFSSREFIGGKIFGDEDSGMVVMVMVVVMIMVMVTMMVMVALMGGRKTTNGGS